jgi:hypothetical protein
VSRVRHFANPCSTFGRTARVCGKRQTGCQSCQRVLARERQCCHSLLAFSISLTGPSRSNGSGLSLGGGGHAAPHFPPGVTFRLLQRAVGKRPPPRGFSPCITG